MVRTCKTAVFITLLFVFPCRAQETHQPGSDSEPSTHRARWMRDAGFGVSTHYFARDASRLDDVTRKFNVNKVADQLADTGAGWFLFTLHHQPWLMSAPNKTYDRITGSDHLTAERDLPLDLANALEKKDVRLMLYVNLRLDPNSACSDEIREAMGGWPPDDQLVENVASTYREFSERYGEKVAGWWVDGAWLGEFKNSPRRKKWFQTIRKALLSGNPDAVVAFNPGLDHSGMYARFNDYLAGEQANLDHLPDSPVIKGAQWHAWTYLGGWWAAGGTRFETDRLVNYAKKAVSNGGAVTFEVGTEGYTRASRKADRVKSGTRGVIDPEQVKQLRAVGDALKTKRSGDPAK